MVNFWALVSVNPSFHMWFVVNYELVEGMPLA